MKMLKKVTALALGLAMLIGMCAVQAEEACGLTCGAAAEMLLAAMDEHPDPDSAALLQDPLYGALDPQAEITRVQALRMLNRAFGELSAPEGDSARMVDPAALPTDIPEDAAAELADLLAAGIVIGNADGLLLPDGAISGEELQLLVRRVQAYLGSNLKDDFYAAVNHDWLNASELPAGLSINGPFYGMSYTVNQQVAALIAEIDAQPQTPGTAEAKIKALYDCVLDMDARAAEGIAPIGKYLRAIQGAATVQELVAADEMMYDELGVSTLLGFSVTTDLADSSRHIVAFSGPGATLNKDFYANGTPAQYDAYHSYIETLFALSGLDPQRTQASADALYAAEGAIAAASLDPQEYGDVEKIYNLYSFDALDALLPDVNLAQVYAHTGLEPTDRILVMDVGALEAAAALFDDAHLEELRALARMGLLMGVGATLNPEFLEANFDFTLAFYGVDARQSDEEIAAQLVQSLLADYLGRAYAEAYFTPEAKADVEEMIREFIEIYKERLQQADWLSAETRARAVGKLDAMQIKVGYPDSWESYLDGAEIRSPEEGGSFFANTIAIQKAALADAVSRQNAPVDKSEWKMEAYTVNACYDFTANDITFPAAILQAPLYDVHACREENLGGIGYIIAHEISHAFDNNGAKFDENGNSADWWTEADYAAFQERCAAVIDWYDGQEAYPGICCNGELTLSENVADLGSLRCLMEAAQRLEDPDYDALFRAVANTWASTTSRQLRAYLSVMDVHAPDKLRCNRALQTLDEFYETYGIQSGDGMWTEPESRVSVW